MTDIQVGDLLRYTANPNQFWKVARLTSSSAWLAPSDAQGRTAPFTRLEQFRRASVLRDFHPA